MASTYQRRIARYMAEGATREEARARAQGTHGRFHIERRAGRLIVETKSAQRVRTEVGHAAAAGKRVAIQVKTKDGETRRLFENKGHKAGASAQWVKGQLGTKAGHVKAVLAEQSRYDDGSDYVPGSEIEVDEMSEFQVTIYD